jgi:hypothetical protein
MKKRSLIAVALLAACGEADPLPSPAKPELASESVFLSSAEAASDVTVVVMGLPGAAQGKGQIEIAQLRDGARVRDLVTAPGDDGAFAATFEGRVGDALQIRFKRDDGALSDALERTVGASSVTAMAGRTAEQPTAAPPVEADSVGFAASTGPRFTTSAPDALGTVTVQGADLAPGLEALVAVPARASSARATVDAAGKFSVRLRGNAGDTLHVFTRDPASGQTSPTASQVIPAP